MFLFDEQQDTTLTSPLAVDSSPVRGNGGPTTLPPGSQVSSFLVHGDKIGANATPVGGWSGSRTFADPIVGVITSGANLTGSDSRVGIPGDGTDFGAAL